MEMRWIDSSMPLLWLLIWFKYLVEIYKKDGSVIHTLLLWFFGVTFGTIYMWMPNAKFHEGDQVDSDKVSAIIRPSARWKPVSLCLDPLPPFCVSRISFCRSPKENYGWKGDAEKAPRDLRMRHAHSYTRVELEMGQFFQNILCFLYILRLIAVFSLEGGRHLY